MREEYVDYRDGDTALQGFWCVDDSLPAPRPTVLICHSAAGRDEFVERKARRLAWQGYACFALDIFGAGVRAQTGEQKRALMAPWLADRRRLLRRVQAGMAAALARSGSDRGRVAVMGFCFGGLAALDLARADAEIRGAISFHGLLTPSGFTEPRIRAKVLILHGYDDPLAPPEDLLAVAREFTVAGADWQVHAYGNTVHAFTHPHANDRAAGLQYDAAADRRSWHTLEGFLGEVLK